ncbi:MAG TPA: methyltransferase domain-containing protein, partial [Leucothrix sp.]|nr:methyltransferase domain-containing protein [Leucothrix sp.]
DETMMFPRVEGRMLQELELDINDECLEIGTGSGFTAACMATMTKHVDSIDIYDDFLVSAEQKFKALNISNVSLENKDALSLGDAGKQYDAIAVTGSLPEYSSHFERLLKPNGRLFIIVGTGETMHAMKVLRKESLFVRETLFETKLKKLVGAEEKSKFSF